MIKMLVRILTNIAINSQILMHFVLASRAHHASTRNCCCRLLSFIGRWEGSEGWRGGGLRGSQPCRDQFDNQKFLELNDNAMSLYHEAAAVLANADNTGGSLTSRIFSKKGLKSSPGQIYALIVEASKWSLVLKDVVEKCGLLAAERKVRLKTRLRLMNMTNRTSSRQLSPSFSSTTCCSLRRASRHPPTTCSSSPSPATKPALAQSSPKRVYDTDMPHWTRSERPSAMADPKPMTARRRPDTRAGCG